MRSSLLLCLLLLTNCQSETPSFNEAETEYTASFMSYLKSVHNVDAPNSVTYLALTVDCYSCSEAFIQDFASESRIESLVPIICGLEGSEEITENVRKILQAYPEALIDKPNKFLRYKASESGKSVMVRTNQGKPVQYWDLGLLPNAYPIGAKNWVSGLLAKP